MKDRTENRESILMGSRGVVMEEKKEDKYDPCTLHNHMK
jgi:hypothetical protein